MNYHIVEAGDTLYKLAKTYNISVGSIIKANPGINTNMLTIGKVLFIPISPKEECSWATHESQLYKVSFNYPQDLEKVMTDYYKGPSGFFVVSAINSELPLDKVCKKEAYQDLKFYGSNPIIKNVEIHDTKACLILPSSDQVKELDNQTALIIKYPKPIIIKDMEYNYLMIWADKGFIQKIADSLTFIN